MDIKSLASALATQLNQLGSTRASAPVSTAPQTPASGEILVARVVSVTPLAPATADGKSTSAAQSVPPTATASAPATTTTAPASTPTLPATQLPAATGTSGAIISTPPSHSASSNTTTAAATVSATTPPATPAPLMAAPPQPGPPSALPPSLPAAAASSTPTPPASTGAPIISANQALPVSATQLPASSALATYAAVLQTGTPNNHAHAAIPSPFSPSAAAGVKTQAFGRVTQVLLELQLTGNSANSGNRLQVVSDRAIVANDQLVLRRGANGELRLLGATDARAAQLSALNIDEILQQLRPLAPLDQLRDARRMAISEGLGNTLTTATELRHPIRTLAVLVRLIGALEPSLRQALVGARLDELLSRLLAAAPNSAQLSQAATLAQALRTSGTSLEAQLQGALTLGAPANQLRLSQLVNQDQKALLLQVRAAAQAQIAEFIHQAPPASILQVLQHKPALDASLGQLLAGLLNLRGQSAKVTEHDAIRAQLLSHIKHLASAGLAQLQLHQAQALLSRTEPETAAQQQLQFEMNVRHGAELQPLQLQLYREEVAGEPQTDSEAREASARKVWCVLLTLTLAHLGEVSIELKLDARHLHTRVWCKDPSSIATLNAAQPRLEALFAQENLELKQMEILPGEPPVKKMSINYNLVDVRT